jgi:hypothetical protein
VELRLLFGRVSVAFARTPVFVPTRLSGAAKRFAPFLRTDISPSGGTKTNGLPLYWRWRQFSACHVEDLQREVEQYLWGQSGLSHDAAKRDAAPNA